RRQDPESETKHRDRPRARQRADRRARQDRPQRACSLVVGSSRRPARGAGDRRRPAQPGPGVYYLGVVAERSEMSAVRAHAEGGPEALIFEQAPLPALGYGDVLVRVEAASFTPTELGWPSPWTDRSGKSRLPTIPGHELSGV